ncbi:hypothetical protein NQZ79_g8348 [Umbelopsis isabellina]|nr:hypothetical protein NQZ79_g8348 [Umbelopsis isabellina]
MSEGFNANVTLADRNAWSTDDPESDETLRQRQSIEINSGPDDFVYASDNEHVELAEIPDVTQPMPVASGAERTQEATPLQLNENKLIIFAILIPVSILGMLIRLGLSLLESYAGAPVFALAYVQFIGCVIMGLVTDNKDYLLKKYLPLQIALSTGLCGSITTFSSWQLAVYNAFVNASGDSHGTGYNVRKWFAIMSIAGLQIGYHIAYALRHTLTQHFAKKMDARPYNISPTGYQFPREPIDFISLTLGSISWIVVIIIASTVATNRKLSIACVFAPMGTLLRWWLSRYNTRMPGFPLGTLMANLFATLVLAVVTLLMSGPVNSLPGCSVLQAITDGFCGNYIQKAKQLANLNLKLTLVISKDV